MTNQPKSVSTFTTTEQDQENFVDEHGQTQQGLLYTRVTTWKSGTKTYEPIMVKTVDSVTWNGTTITYLEKHYDENGKLHHPQIAAMKSWKYEINPQNQLVQQGVKESYYWHGFTPEEAAEMAHFENKITEEEYHTIAHPEKSLNTTYEEAAQILAKGL
jgi:hypothetical protein